MSDYSLTIDSTDLAKFQNVLAKAPEKTMSEMKQAFQDTSEWLVSKAQSYAPHKTGTLQSSIHIEPPTVTPGSIQQSVGTDLFYAPYQEYGTGIYGPKGTPIVPKNAPFLVFKLPDGSWRRAKSVKGVKPKEYMKKAFTEGKPVFDAKVKAALDAIVSFLAKG